MNVASLNYARAADVSAVPDNWSMLWRLLACMVAAGWVVKASSNGDTKVAPATPATQNLLTLANVGAGGTGPSVTTLAQGTFATITGLSGLVAPTENPDTPNSEGNFITFAGFASAGNNGTFQIVKVLSASSCVVRNTGAVAGDANNGLVGVTWQEKSVLSAAYVQATWSSKAPWMVLAGPRRVKVPVSSNPSGFIVGEDVTQGAGSTQRRGRLQGIVFGASSGWAVVDPYGDNAWDTSLVTGATSAATLTPSSTPIVYQVEALISKSSSNYNSGSIYWVCVDPSGESAQLLSAIAATADATASSPPGFTSAGATSLPASGIVACGTTKAATPSQSGAHGNFGNTTGTTYSTKAQITVANATPREDRLVDGSWWALSMSSVAGAFRTGWGWQVCDRGRPGDLAPYASWSHGATTGSFNRQAAAMDTGEVSAFTLSGYNGAVYHNWRFCIARGSGTSRDAVSCGAAAGLCLLAVSPVDALLRTPASIARDPCHPDATPPPITESPMLCGDGSLTLSDGSTDVKCLKGRPRFFLSAGTGALLSTYGYDFFAVVAQSGTSNRALIVGPGDGATTPTS